ncbi:TlpA disulfide reductase family protein [Phytomonospora sp. NPDC050363]|uniref:TlpA family protein disulfide reductase n=1 Tax=Phytomonospora sp. NPDC050363 TaxID=3155642 RepID=UPI0033DA4C95
MRVKPLAAVLAALFLLSACGSGGDAATNQQAYVSQDGQTTVYDNPADRPTAPALSGEDLHGNTLDVAAAYPGKVIVVNFWASWCAPCRAEGPELVEVAEATAALDVVFVGIDIRDERSKAQAFEQGLGVGYPSFFDPSGRLSLQFTDVPPTTIPATIVIDREGRIAAVFRKALIASALQPTVEQIALESGPRPNPSASE